MESFSKKLKIVSSTPPTFKFIFPKFSIYILFPIKRHIIGITHTSTYLCKTIKFKNPHSSPLSTPKISPISSHLHSTIAILTYLEIPLRTKRMCACSPLVTRAESTLSLRPRLSARRSALGTDK